MNSTINCDQFKFKLQYYEPKMKSTCHGKFITITITFALSNIKNHFFNYRFCSISVGGKKYGASCVFDKSITTAEKFIPPIEKDEKKSKKKSFRSGNTVEAA